MDVARRARLEKITKMPQRRRCLRERIIAGMII